MNRSILYGIMILTFIRPSAQTTIDARKFSMSIRNEIICYSAEYSLTLPHLETNRQDDVREKINDSLLKIAKNIIGSANEYLDDFNDACDTAGIEFYPETYSMEYRVWQNSGRLLSLYVISGSAAGGGGNGFGSTDYFFNVDHFNNEMITIDSLFNAKNKIALQQWVNKNLGSLVKEQGYTELISDSINIFGPTGEERPVFTFVGFNLDSTSLILTYDRDVGRGNYSFHFRLPLKEIQPYINKKYRWIYSGLK